MPVAHRIPGYLRRCPDLGSIGTVDLAPTMLVCSTCDRPLAECARPGSTCSANVVTDHVGSVIGELHRRRTDLTDALLEDLLDAAQSAVITPERAVDLYREPIWAGER